MGRFNIANRDNLRLPSGGFYIANRDNERLSNGDFKLRTETRGDFQGRDLYCKQRQWEIFKWGGYIL